MNTNPPTAVLLPIVKKVYPSLIASQITGVQPMMQPLTAGLMPVILSAYDRPLNLTPVTAPKYKFSRAKWHTAQIWRMFADIGFREEWEEWCRDNFGPHPKTPDAWSRWYFSWGTIYIRDEADYILYQLRWSDEA